MFNAKQTLMAAALAAAALAAPAGVVVAQEANPARENVMKACGDKWRAVRETESAKGVTWPQFLSRCRAEAGATPAATAEKAEPAKKPARSVRKRATEAAGAPSGSLVFPVEVSARHAGERPALARQRTCAEQFKANKATGANGGLRWIQKGGGYWSKCNAHLKQLRA